MSLLLALALCAALVPSAAANEGCATPAPASSDAATRIAAVACAEHALWYSPFIDDKGRLASIRVSEAEGIRLRDGVTPAWRRVAQYWQGSGVGWPPDGLPPGADCFAGATGQVGTALCRAFLVDTPWSAVFVSYVMGRAGVPGFRHSARHVDYVRAAHRDGVNGPYRMADPDAEPPAVGDLLCFARVPSQAFGYAGFRNWLERPLSGALAMHCDIVVSAGGGHARVVGGNVLQGVTMRMLPLNATGRFWSLPRRTGGEAECGPANASMCNLNRQDWVALLKLNPVASIPSPLTTPPLRSCCEVCTLPLPPGVQRCSAPAVPRPLPES